MFSVFFLEFLSLLSFSLEILCILKVGCCFKVCITHNIPETVIKHVKIRVIMIIL